MKSIAEQHLEFLKCAAGDLDTVYEAYVLFASPLNMRTIYRRDRGGIWWYRSITLGCRSGPCRVSNLRSMLDSFEGSVAWHHYIC